MKRILNFFKKNGIVLGMLRLWPRTLRAVRTKINTLYWSMFLGRMGKNTVIECGVHFENPAQVYIGNNAYIGADSYFSSENYTGTLTIEDNVHIGYRVKIDHTGDTTIGSGTLLSANVKIFTHTHGYEPRSVPIALGIIVESSCWIAEDVVITERTRRIASGVVVGIRSVVTGSLCTESGVYIGTPAKFLKLKSQ